ncbi:MAG TPA: cytochrome c biogenesis protein CcdA [Dehalococcoidia bacterium]|nr:cytochrome c biogenesis protein CcdA [Dehalococcoidia bacterium]
MNPLDPAAYQSAVSGWLVGLPLAYAFGAGMLASVNPCGFLMLPAYATYYVSTEDAAQRTTAAARSLRAVQLGLIATIGFLAVFGPLGLVISLDGHALVRLFPYASLVIGALLIVLGVSLLLTRRRVSLGLAERVRLTRSRSPRGVFRFGIAYAVASLGCTLPVFIIVVGTAVSAHSFINALVQFLNYALGMGLVLMVVSVGAALAQGAVTNRLRHALPYVEQTGAALLVAAGVYLLYVWFSLGRVLA